MPWAKQKMLWAVGGLLLIAVAVPMLIVRLAGFSVDTNLEPEAKRVLSAFERMSLDSIRKVGSPLSGPPQLVGDVRSVGARAKLWVESSPSTRCYYLEVTPDSAPLESFSACGAFLPEEQGFDEFRDFIVGRVAGSSGGEILVNRSTLSVETLPLVKGLFLARLDANTARSGTLEVVVRDAQGGTVTELTLKSQN